MQIAKITRGKSRNYRIEMQIDETLHFAEYPEFFECLRNFLDIVSRFRFSKENLLFEFTIEN